MMRGRLFVGQTHEREFAPIVSRHPLSCRNSMPKPPHNPFEKYPKIVYRYDGVFINVLLHNNTWAHRKAHHFHSRALNEILLRRWLHS